MFVFSLKYIAPLEEVDALLPDHVAWLKAQHEAGHFIAWGRKVPREGGLIMAHAPTREMAEELAASDPFVKGGAAEVEVIEFSPSFVAPGLEGLQG
ncbi:YciI family protein [Qipengyuania sp. NPDC077563]|uniref:YciI family protein n=1 Tax=Qipengyuania sp. NPDC077563 TaxID=3364497 RepID=UPI00384FE2D6